MAEYRSGWHPASSGRKRAHAPSIAHAVNCGLRRGVGRTIIPLKQFDRHSSSRAEIVIGRTHVEMKFAGIVLVANIALKPANIRSGKIPKAVVMQSFERAIYGKIIVLPAPLR